MSNSCRTAASSAIVFGSAQSSIIANWRRSQREKAWPHGKEEVRKRSQGAVKRELDRQSAYKLLPLTSHLDLDQEEAEGGGVFTCRKQVATNICGKRMISQTMGPEGGFWKQSTIGR